MKNLEWTFKDQKENLPPGEWQIEPDKMQFTDEDTGLPCLIVRNGVGGLCTGEKEHGICHIVEEGENDKVWWLGFDCVHSGDLSPYMSDKFKISGEVYRNIEYVKNEIKNLAKQLKEVA